MMEKGSSRTAPADTASVNVLRDSLGDRRASVTGVGQREGRGGQSKGAKPETFRSKESQARISLNTCSWKTT